jgi:hypothetical protein
MNVTAKSRRVSKLFTFFASRGAQRLPSREFPTSIGQEINSIII